MPDRQGERAWKLEHRGRPAPLLAACRSLSGCSQRTITAAAVGADVDRQLGSTGTGMGTQCIKEPDHKVRWACQRPPPAAPPGACVVVRVQPWTPWNSINGGRLCAHLPGLVKKVHAAGTA